LLHKFGLLRNWETSDQLPEKARWLVPKMVKDGFYSSFVFSRLIWACLMGNLGRVERWQIMGF
jgi:hypothetical protein